MGYSPKEMMVVAAARKIKNGDIVFCGTGISMLAAMAAKHTNAPDSVIFFETGAVDSTIEDLPLAVSDPRVMHNAALHCTLLEAFSFLQNPKSARNIVGIVGAAQIDPYGNLNSTAIGNYHTPDVRLPGSGGACDMMAFAPRTIIFMTLEKRKFVEQVDYITSPGWLSHRDSMKKGEPPDRGPACVITDMGTMAFDETSKRMFLKGYFKDIPPPKIKKRVGFEIDISRAEEIPEPKGHELKILREKCDPERLILF